jgi:hypothetical protein
MHKELADHIKDLEMLRAKRECWEEAYNNIVESAWSLETLDPQYFPPDQLYFALPQDRSSLKTIFPRARIIEDRLKVRRYELSLRKMDALLDILELEQGLGGLDNDAVTKDLSKSQISEVMRILDVYNDVADTQARSDIALTHHQIPGHEKLDGKVLSKRYNELTERFQTSTRRAQADIHAEKDEIHLLDELHEARLGYASLHVEEANLYLEHAMDILRQRAQSIFAVSTLSIMGDDKLMADANELVDMSLYLGLRASKITGQLKDYYDTMETAGFASGAVFLPTRFVPMNIDFPVGTPFTPAT